MPGPEYRYLVTAARVNTSILLRLCLAGVTALTCRLVPAVEYPCPPWPSSQSPFWEPMHYRATATPKGVVLLAEGQIQSGESGRLKAQLQKAMAQPGGISEVWFNSPGGDSEQGQAMGRVLRTLGVPTRIRSGAFCVSACSVAFLGGVFRTVEPGGTYTVHMFSSFSGLASDARLKSTVKDLQGLEKDSARYAAQRYQYLLEMGISPAVAQHGFSVDNFGESCPPRSVLKQWNVDNGS